MSAYRTPFRFLEEGETEEHGNVGRPLTICDADNNDLANVYSRDDATVSTTREEAIAVAHLIVAAPDLLAALKRAKFVLESPALPQSLVNGGGVLEVINAAIAKAEGKAP